MPYIEKKDRDDLDPKIIEIVEWLRRHDFSAGCINYVISQIMVHWFKYCPRYVTICKIMGTLQCVAAEFFRRHAAGYENQKAAENGDLESYW
jgi:hypothetical protein